ncbi:hypothetical protein AAY473_015877, partial [Plecturocebus cupreus]
MLFERLLHDHHRQGLAPLPRLECSGTIIAHCSLKLLGSSNSPSSVAGTTVMCHNTWLIKKIFFTETGSQYVAQAGLKLNSWPQSILLPQTPRVLGLQTSATLESSSVAQACSGAISPHCNLYFWVQ